MKEKKRKKEDGLLTVEASVTLTSFIMVVLGVISVINIYIIHSKIQFAMFQAVKEMSAYTYLYQITGLREADKTIDEDANNAQKDLKTTIKSVDTFVDQATELRDDAQDAINSTTTQVTSYEEIEEIYNKWDKTVDQGKETVEAGKESFEQIKNLVQDPKGILNALIAAVTVEAKDGIKNWALSLVSGGMVEKHLVSGQQIKAEQLLARYGIVPDKSGKYLRFNNSEFFVDEGHKYMDLVVEYDMEIFLFKAFMKDAKIHMIQRVMMPAWLDGDGRHYEEKKSSEGE